MMFSYQLKILEQHLDTFGHVNNAQYLVFFEEARWQMLEDIGSGMAEIIRDQKGPVILEANVKFLKELKLRHTVTVTTEILEHNGKIGKIKHQILNESKDVMTEAILVFGYFDLATRKLLPLPDLWVKAMT